MRRVAFACRLALLAACFLAAGRCVAEEPAGTGASAPAASTAAPATALLVVYVETELREPGLAAPPGPDEDLVEWKVPELGRLLRERVPLVLAANGMSGSAVVVTMPFDPAAVSAMPGPRPLLLLGISSYKKSRSALRKQGSVVLDARLFDRGPPETPRWHEGLSGALGFDPVFGVLKTNRVDEQWVDGILLIALDRLARAGYVKLSVPKAVRPK
jgi:hypothetical protein